MKKIITLSLLFISYTTFSQVQSNEESTQEIRVTSQEINQDGPIHKRDFTYNELSIGALNLVAFGAIDIAYERILTPNTTWAVETFFLALNKDNEDLSGAYDKDFSLTGKVKYFFSEHRHAWGFYVNGFSMISSGNFMDEVYDSQGYYRFSEEVSYTDFALGFGLGGKFVATQGFFVDLSAGIGRNLFNSNSPTIVGQFNTNLGFRF